MADAEHHVVYRAVADFSNLAAEVAKARALIRSLREDLNTGSGGGAAAGKARAAGVDAATAAEKRHTGSVEEGLRATVRQLSAEQLVEKTRQTNARAEEQRIARETRSRETAARSLVQRAIQGIQGASRAEAAERTKAEHAAAAAADKRRATERAARLAATQQMLNDFQAGQRRLAAEQGKADAAAARERARLIEQGRRGIQNVQQQPVRDRASMDKLHEQALKEDTRREERERQVAERTVKRQQDAANKLYDDAVKEDARRTRRQRDSSNKLYDDAVKEDFRRTRRQAQQYEREFTSALRHNRRLDEAASKHAEEEAKKAERAENARIRRIGLTTGVFTTVGRGASAIVGGIRSLVRRRTASKDEEQPDAGDGGGGGARHIFGPLAAGLANFGDGATAKFGKLSKVMFSFRGLIIVGVAALGPLVAALGTLGGVAVGAANGMVALAGASGALPGLFAAAAAGVGALFVALQPMQDVFKAFSDQAKVSSVGAQELADRHVAAADALANAQHGYIAASRAMTDAQFSEQRSQEGLNDARKEAARGLQDLRTALRRTALDEEGARLAVAEAEANYRKTLANGNATALERAEAAHRVKTSHADLEDTLLKNTRTTEDANLAEQRGVEGAPAVVSARKSVADASYASANATYQMVQAAHDLQKAQRESAAGGAEAYKAQLEVDAALAKLSPSARRVALAVRDQAGAWKQLQQNVQERMFAPIAANMGAIRSLLGGAGGLNDLLGKAAGAIGTVAAKGLAMVTSGPWKRDFATLANNNVGIIANLGDAALSVADAFRNITLAAAPFTTWVTQAIKDVAGQFARWAEGSRRSGGIADFLDIVKQRIEEVAKIGSNLFGLFKSLFFAGNDFSTWMYEGIEKITGAWERWGKAQEKPGSSFRTYLENSKPLIESVATALGALAVTFGKIAADPKNIEEAKRIFDVLAKQVMPPLVGIFHDLSESGVISKVASGIGGFLDAIQGFLDNGGALPITTFLNTLLTALTAIFTVLSNPVGARVASALFTALSLLAAASIIGKVSGLTRAIRLLGGGLGRLKGTSAIAKIFEGLTNLPGVRFLSGLLDKIMLAVTKIPGFNALAGVFSTIGKYTGLTKLFDSISKAGSAKDDKLTTGSDANTVARRDARTAGDKDWRKATGGTYTVQLDRIIGLLERCCSKLGGTGAPDPDPHPSRPGPATPGAEPHTTGGPGAAAAAGPLEAAAAALDRAATQLMVAARMQGENSLLSSLPLPGRRGGAGAAAAERTAIESAEHAAVATTARRALPSHGGEVIEGEIVHGVPATRTAAPGAPLIEGELAPPRRNFFQRMVDNLANRWRGRPRPTGGEPITISRPGTDVEQFVEQAPRRNIFQRMGDRLSDRWAGRTRPAGGEPITISRPGTDVERFVEQAPKRNIFQRIGDRLSDRWSSRPRPAGGEPITISRPGTDVERYVEQAPKRNIFQRMGDRLADRWAARAPGTEVAVREARTGGRFASAARGAGRLLGRGGYAAMRAGRMVASADPLTWIGLGVGTAADAGLFGRRGSAGKSLGQAAGAIATGAGIGMSVGGPIGAVAGAVAGAGYSLYKDPNLRRLAVRAQESPIGMAVNPVGWAATAIARGGAHPEGKSAPRRAWDGLYENFMKDAGSPIAKWFTTSLPKAFHHVGDFFTKTLPQQIHKVGYILTHIPETLRTNFVKAWGAVLGFIEYDIPFYWGKFVNLLKDTLFSSKWWSSLWNDTIWPNTIGALINAWNGFWDLMGRTIGSGKWWSSIWNDYIWPNTIGGLINGFKAVWNFITNDLFSGKFWQGLWNDVIWKYTIGPLKDAWDTIFALVSKLFTAKFWSDAWNTIWQHTFGPMVRIWDKIFGGNLAGDVQKEADKRAHEGQDTRAPEGSARTLTPRNAKQSGGEVAGTYDGRVDTKKHWLTVGEYVMRRRISEKPQGKQLLEDLNNERLNPADFYAALNVNTSMARVGPVNAPRVATVTHVNNASTRNAGLHLGDVTINNPVRERSEQSLRRRLQSLAYLGDR